MGRRRRHGFISMSVVEGLEIHVCGTYVLSVWFTLLIGFGSQRLDIFS